MSHNTDYTPRQMQSSFQPPISIPPLPLDMDVPSVPSEEQEIVPTTEQQEIVPTTDQQDIVPTSEQQEIVPTTDQQESVPTTDQQESVPTSEQQEIVPTTDQQESVPTTEQQEVVPTSEQQEIVPTTEQQEIVPTTDPPQRTMRAEAPSFTPSFTPSTNSGNLTTTSFIYDLNKYKYDYFISKLSCSFDPILGKFGLPTGVCTLNDDRLLVANYELDSLLLLDIQGTVYEIYRNLPAPKDVLYYSSNPHQAVVATRKEVVILDLSTKQVVMRSSLRGFYPWNIQHIKEHDLLAACDPSGERIIYFDKNLSEIGGWSFNDQAPGQFQGYEKVYPYAAHFFPDNTSLVLNHRRGTCQLAEYDTATGIPKKIFSTPPGLQSHSIYVDSKRRCLIADKVKHRLVSINHDSTIEEYTWKSVKEPYSMTFLSNGTLCVTDSTTIFGSNGGIAVLSEVDLKANP